MQSSSVYNNLPAPSSSTDISPSMDRPPASLNAFTYPRHLQRINRPVPWAGESDYSYYYRKHRYARQLIEKQRFERRLLESIAADNAKLDAVPHNRRNMYGEHREQYNESDMGKRRRCCYSLRAAGNALDDSRPALVKRCSTSLWTGSTATMTVELEDPLLWESEMKEGRQAICVAADFITAWTSVQGRVNVETFTRRWDYCLQTGTPFWEPAPQPITTSDVSDMQVDVVSLVDVSMPNASTIPRPLEDSQPDSSDMDLDSFDDAQGGPQTVQTSASIPSQALVSHEALPSEATENFQTRLQAAFATAPETSAQVTPPSDLDTGFIFEDVEQAATTPVAVPETVGPLGDNSTPVSHPVEGDDDQADYDDIFASVYNEAYEACAAEYPEAILQHLEEPFHSPAYTSSEQVAAQVYDSYDSDSDDGYQVSLGSDDGYHCSPGRDDEFYGSVSDSTEDAERYYPEDVANSLEYSNPRVGDSDSTHASIEETETYFDDEVKDSETSAVEDLHASEGTPEPEYPATLANNLDFGLDDLVDTGAADFLHFVAHVQYAPPVVSPGDDKNYSGDSRGGSQEGERRCV